MLKTYLIHFQINGMGISDDYILVKANTNDELNLKIFNYFIDILYPAFYENYDNMNDKMISKELDEISNGSLLKYCGMNYSEQLEANKSEKFMIKVENDKKNIMDILKKNPKFLSDFLSDLYEYTGYLFLEFWDLDNIECI